jgi:uncharacterized protein YbcV (DUF1398 family)
MLAEIQSAYMAAKSYPDLARELIKLGVQSYTVDVSSEITIYRFVNGKTVTRQPVTPPQEIAMKTDAIAVQRAIKDNVEGNSDYAGFMTAIAKAGIRFYEATLTGDNPRVTYLGIGGEHIEPIPL